MIGYSAGGSSPGCGCKTTVALTWCAGSSRSARHSMGRARPRSAPNSRVVAHQLGELVLDSDLLRRLNASDETPDGPLWATHPVDERPGGDARSIPLLYLGR